MQFGVPQVGTYSFCSHKSSRSMFPHRSEVLEEPSDAFQMCGISYSVASVTWCWWSLAGDTFWAPSDLDLPLLHKQWQFCYDLFVSILCSHAVPFFKKLTPAVVVVVVVVVVIIIIIIIVFSPCFCRISTISLHNCRD